VPGPDARRRPADRAGRVSLGRILRVHGLRGEVVVQLHGGDPERLGRIGRVGIEGAGPAVERAVERARWHRSGGLLKFEGIDTPEQARALVGAEIFADAAALPALEPGCYYHFQLVGLIVRTEEGEVLGPVAEVIEAGASDLLVVPRAGREHLIPVVEEIVRSVDLEAGVIEVRLPQGLLDL
jgi:16S rRNA processing protein RimM